ncbi:MAG: hypothetical protein OSB38_17145 [Paraburkholderia fungorum]|nr:hypothetical protein [Paraburkholderia fungorum]
MAPKSTRSSPPEDWAALTAQEYGRLKALNEELKQAERWIRRRGKDMVVSYSLAAAQERHAFDGQLDEDVELAATMLFLTKTDSPPTTTKGDRIVAQIDIPILSKLHRLENTAPVTLRTDVEEGRSNDPWCPLLLDLYNRALQQDTTKLLSIDALCIDVVLIRQRLRSWEKFHCADKA